MDITLLQIRAVIICTGLPKKVLENLPAQTKRPIETCWLYMMFPKEKLL
jgi:hypothetical protein